MGWRIIQYPHMYIIYSYMGQTYRHTHTDRYIYMFACIHVSMIMCRPPAAVSRPFSHAETMEVSMRIVPLWVNTPRSARSTQNETLSVINFNSTSGDFQGQLLPVSRHTGHSSLKQQRCAHLDTSGGRCEEFHGVFYF